MTYSKNISGHLAASVTSKVLKFKKPFKFISSYILSQHVGCDRPDLQPTSINGWFWTAELQKLAATTDRRQNDWSENGGIGQPQPDNRELQQGGAPENCLAILNNFYNDGVHWHDVGEYYFDLILYFVTH